MIPAKNMEIVLLQNIKKNYGQDKVVTEALRGVDLKLVKGDFSVMMGPSGSGKSTLLNIIGGLDRATSGKTIINGQDFDSLSIRLSPPTVPRNRFSVFEIVFQGCFISDHQVGFSF